MNSKEEKMYTFLRGYCEARNYFNSLLALPYARDMHDGLKRKSGEAYIIHPLGLATYGIDIGLSTDEIIATCLLHDVMEDTTSTLSDLRVSDKVKQSVQLLTFRRGNLLKPDALQIYYDHIKDDENATFVKLLDRYNNLQTMASVFTLAKIIEYTKETIDYIYPLMQEAKLRYPLKRNELNILKCNIESLVNTIEGMLEFVPDDMERARVRKTSFLNKAS